MDHFRDLLEAKKPARRGAAARAPKTYGSLSEQDTIKLGKIIESEFDSLNEKKQKSALSIPGIKGKVSPTLKTEYNSKADYDEKNGSYFIKIAFEFNYIGLGNHPANNKSLSGWIKVTEGKISVLIGGIYEYPGVEISKPKLSPSDKKLILGFVPSKDED